MTENVQFYANRYDAKVVNSSTKNRLTPQMNDSVDYLIKEVMRKLILMRAVVEFTDQGRELLDDVIDNDLIKLQTIAKALSGKQLSGKTS